MTGMDASKGTAAGGGQAASSVKNPAMTAYRLLQRTLLKIVPAPADRFWMDFSTQGWANRCLPLRMANQAGWFILNEADFEVIWSGKPQVESLKILFPKGQYSPFVSSMFGYGILTWEIPYLFRTPPGYNLLARGPANFFKDGVVALEGLVETDWAVSSFTMNWKVTRPFKAIKFQKDDPVCMIVPQRRGELERLEPGIQNIESEPDLHRAYNAWLESRRAWVSEAKNKPRAEGSHAPHQGHYTRGVTITGEQMPEHQTSLGLRPFDEKEPALPGSTDVSKPARPQEGNSRLGVWARIKEHLGAR